MKLSYNKIHIIPIILLCLIGFAEIHSFGQDEYEAPPVMMQTFFDDSLSEYKGWTIEIAQADDECLEKSTASIESVNSWKEKLEIAAQNSTYLNVVGSKKLENPLIRKSYFREAAQEFPYNLLYKTTKSAILLAPETKWFFPGLDFKYFNGSYVGIKYVFYPIMIMDDDALQGLPIMPINYYLIKEYDASISSKLSKIPYTEKKKDSVHCRNIMQYKLLRVSQGLSSIQIAIQLISSVKFPESFYMLGGFYEQLAQKQSKDVQEQAFISYKQSAEKGYIPALHKMSLKLLIGEGCEKNIPLALNNLEELSRLQYADSTYILGIIYRYGSDNVHQDLEKAKLFLTRAAQQGNFAARKELGMIYIEEENWIEARRWMGLVAEQEEDYQIYYYMALISFELNDNREAKKWLNLAKAIVNELRQGIAEHPPIIIPSDWSDAINILWQNLHPEQILQQ